MSHVYTDPVREFHDWFAEVQQTSLRDPNAMALATVSQEGWPAVRMVLMKHFDQQGLVFYTNFTSKKARDLLATQVASACFFWETTRKQVRVSGRVEVVTDAEADAYFAGRPRDSKLGAWASLQSQSMHERTEFEERFSEVQRIFEGREVPRPSHWSGFRIVPDRVEFWIEKPYRLHDRYVFTREANAWKRTLLYP